MYIIIVMANEISNIKFLLCRKELEPLILYIDDKNLTYNTITLVYGPHNEIPQPESCLSVY